MNIWVWKIRNYELGIINNQQELIGIMHQSESTPDPWDIVGSITFLQCYFSTPPPLLTLGEYMTITIPTPMASV